MYIYIYILPFYLIYIIIYVLVCFLYIIHTCIQNIMIYSHIETLIYIITIYDESLYTRGSTDRSGTYPYILFGQVYEEVMIKLGMLVFYV